MSKTANEKNGGSNNGLRFLLMLALVLVAAPAAKGEGAPNPWHIALFGGGWLGQNGDIGTYWRAYDRFFSKWAEAYGAMKSGSLSWPDAGAAFGGEIGRALSSRLSLGLAVERLSKKEAGSFIVGSRTDQMEMTLSAFSVSASGRYAVPLTKHVSLTFRAELGALFGSLNQRLDSRMTDGGGVLVTADFDATGFTGLTGIGLDWILGPRFSLQCEAGYRVASLSNWSGTDLHDWGDGSQGHEGALYYVDQRIDTERIPAVYYPGLILGDPSMGTGMVAYRAFKADFSGFRFQVGLAYRFGG